MFVYVLASKTRVLYVGVTNDLVRRVWEHRNGTIAGFTLRYGVHRLVYFEAVTDPENAIRREKQIKGWARVKKVAMIESANPSWNDLAGHWFVDVSMDDPPRLDCSGQALASARDDSHEGLGMTRTRGSG